MTSTNGLFVFFDVGGTLLVSGTSVEELVETLLFARGIVRPGGAVRAAVAAALGEETEAGVARRERYVQIFRALDLAADAPSLAGMLWEASYDLTPPVLAPGARAALELLRGAGARLGVISNWDDSLEDVLARTGIAPYMEVVVSSWRVGWTKPDPRIFEAALERAGVEPARAWHVGDDPRADALGAIEAGMRAVLVDSRAGAPDGMPPGVLRASRVDEAVHLLLEAERAR